MCSIGCFILSLVLLCIPVHGNSLLNLVILDASGKNTCTEGQHCLLHTDENVQLQFSLIVDEEIPNMKLDVSLTPFLQPTEHKRTLSKDLIACYDPSSKKVSLQQPSAPCTDTTIPPSDQPYPVVYSGLFIPRVKDHWSLYVSGGGLTVYRAVQSRHTTSSTQEHLTAAQRKEDEKHY